jgi:SNF2 family DNA or RNA helicase
MSPFKTAPYAHQATALDRMADAPGFALMMGVGTGKSWCVLNDAHLNGVDTLVIVAPSGVHESTWAREEIPKHWSGPEPLVGVTRSGRKDYGLRELLQTPNAPVRIACVHYEALTSVYGLDAVAALLRQSRTGAYMVLDESHNIKTPTSRRTKASWKLGQLAAYRRILSGTMTTRGYEDLYAQFRFLNPAIIGSPSFTAFKQEFCELVTGHASGNSHTFQKLVGYKNLDRLFKRLAPFTFQAHKDQCLDLPAQTWATRPVVLSEAQQQHYNALRSQSITMAENGAIISAEQAITQLLRLQQVLAGHLPTGAGTYEPLPCPRVDACVDVAAQCDGKVLVWARFIPDRTRLLDAFQKAQIGAVLYTGQDDELQRFRRDPGLKALILSAAMGGAGLTLNEAPNAIHYSLSFKWVDLEQSEGRNHRSGQLVPVSYTTLVAPGSVDEHVLATLRAKQDVADVVRNADQLARWVRPT